MFRRCYYIKNYKSPLSFSFCKVNLTDIYLVPRGPLLDSMVDEDGSSKNESKGG